MSSADSFARLVGAPLALACLAVAACSGATSSPLAARDAGALASDGGGPSDTDGASCEAPSNPGADFDGFSECEPDAGQSGSGGTIVDGVYVASSDTVLGGATCSGNYGASTLEVTGGLFLLSLPPAPAEIQNLRYSTAGSELTLTLSCDTDPNGIIGSTQVMPYSATRTQLTLYFPGDDAAGYAAENVVFTRQ